MTTIRGQGLVEICLHTIVTLVWIVAILTAATVAISFFNNHQAMYLGEMTANFILETGVMVCLTFLVIIILGITNNIFDNLSIYSC